MTATVVLLLVFFVSVILNAFFAGYETGFVSCNPIRLRHLAEQENDKNAKRLLRYLDAPERMLTVVLIGTNIALVMGTVAFTRQAGSLWAVLIATPVFLVFGEILPKSMFRLHPTRMARWFVPIIRLFEVILTPVTMPTHWISQHLLRLVARGNAAVPVLMRSPEDMRVLVDESADRGAIEPEEKDMIHSVMDLQTQYAKEVMVPRIDIQALPQRASRAELIALFERSGRTRILIYRDSIDEVIGVVNAFDVLRDTQPEDPDIHRFVKDILHVPDTMRLDDVLEIMRDTKQSMAVVTDEYGGTDGLITLEDILEEIFGEIRDEYDKEDPPIRTVGPNEYVIEARTPLEDVSDAIGSEISDEEVETLGGWVMRAAGRIPARGEVIVQGPFRVTILAGSPNGISSVRLELLPKTVDDDKKE